MIPEGEKGRAIHSEGECIARKGSEYSMTYRVTWIVKREAIYPIPSIRTIFSPEFFSPTIQYSAHFLYHSFYGDNFLHNFSTLNFPLYCSLWLSSFSLINCSILKITDLYAVTFPRKRFTVHKSSLLDALCMSL